MNEITLLLRIIIAVLFLSTSISKLGKVDEHLVLIKEYEIIPKKYIKAFGWMAILLEFLVGLFLFIGFLLNFALLVSSFILLLYSIAISVNLLKGKRSISCGCGGIAGDYKLSWFLVIRNIIIIGIIVTLLFSPKTLANIETIYFHPEAFISMKVLLLYFSSLTVILIFVIISKIIELKSVVFKLLN